MNLNEAISLTIAEIIKIGLPLYFTRLGITQEKISQVQPVLRNSPINSNVIKFGPIIF